ncbi:MAG: hypothetical protein WCK08_00305 [Betaproteobacteria bacterium]
MAQASAEGKRWALSTGRDALAEARALLGTPLVVSPNTLTVAQTMEMA